jgi:acyl carrier protein
MSMTTLQRVCAVVAACFQLPAETVTPDTSPESVEAWDSLGHLTLMLALEQEFAVQIDPEQMEDLTSVGAIAEQLDSHRGQGP